MPLSHKNLTYCKNSTVEAALYASGQYAISLLRLLRERGIDKQREALNLITVPKITK